MLLQTNLEALGLKSQPILKDSRVWCMFAVTSGREWHLELTDPHALEVQHGAGGPGGEGGVQGVGLLDKVLHQTNHRLIPLDYFDASYLVRQARYLGR